MDAAVPGQRSTPLTGREPQLEQWSAYERTAALARRVEQLAHGAPSMIRGVDVGPDLSPLQLARVEFAQGRVALVSRRPPPPGAPKGTAPTLVGIRGVVFKDR